jgi:branched-chain amino acid transport system ATP-binding protein
MSAVLLDVRELQAGYGPSEVLHSVDFTVNEGEVVVILGANGSGKTTTLRAICQMIKTKGVVEFLGRNVVGQSVTNVVRMGLAHVPQGRGTFADLTVEENLRVGGYVRNDDLQPDIERWYSVFPRLEERRSQLAGSLSGGEQQMLAVARALMGRPKLLLLDEPSLGLAPLVVQDLFRHFAELNRAEGVTMLVVEQNASIALDIAHRAYVLEAGRIALSGTADELRANDDVRKAYLGY